MAPIDTNISALNAFSRKYSISANNTANMNSEGFKKNEAVINESSRKNAVTVEISKPGEEASLRAENENQERSEPPPSDVSPSEETIDQLVTERSYQANLKPIQTDDEQKGTIIDIID